MAEPDDLVERDREVAELERVIDGALAGEGAVLLIEGPAGIGKTRLLSEVRRTVTARGALVLSARGSELEREFPFGVVRQLFELALRDPARREAALAGAAETAGTVLGAPTMSEGEAEGSFAALHGLFWLALNLALEAPLVLLVDDIQWSDRPTLRWLAYLSGRIEGQPILVAATQRSTDPGTDPALLGEIAHGPGTVAVRPRPLSTASVATLVRARLGDGADDLFCAACHRATGGNPLLLRELLAALQADRVPPDASHIDVIRDIGPHAVSRTVLLRLARLPASTADVAGAVAVLGDGTDLPAVAALTGHGDATVADDLAALARAEILAPDAPLRFVHPLIRDAVLGEIPPGERELRHARAARVLADANAPRDAVAAQLLNAPRGGEAWVSDLLQEAGREAVRRGAADNAVALLQRALDEPPPADRRPGVLLELGLAEGLVSAPGSVEHLQAALTAQTDPIARAVVSHVLSRILVFLGSVEEGKALAERTAASIGAEHEDVRRAAEAFVFVTALFGAGDIADFTGVVVHRDLDAPGPGARMLNALAALSLMHTGASREEAVPVARRAVADGELQRADPGFLDIAPCQVLTLAEHPGADAAWQESLRTAHQRGSLFAISGLHMWHGFALLATGELEEAAESLEAADREFVLYGYAPNAGLYLAGFRAQTALEQGDVARARRILDVQGDSDVPTDGHRYRLAAELETRLAEGRNEDALAAADRYERLYARLAPSPTTGPFRSGRARALARLGRPEEALAELETELALARAWGAPGTIARTLRIRGEVLGAGGLDDLAVAAELAEGSTLRMETARCLAAHGAALRRHRRPADAREPLRRALELAERCGSPGLAAHVRAELQAAGVRPRRGAMKGVEALTASERRVADLAAEGRTNREIAQELFVTPKTVEVHLGNAYRKLEVRSRRDLEGALSAA